jgi:hypothetical protein
MAELPLNMVGGIDDVKGAVMQPSLSLASRWSINPTPRWRLPSRLPWGIYSKSNF